MARLRAGGFTSALVLFLAVLVVSFPGVFLPGQTLFSNDGPLGQLMAQCHQLPGRFAGCWQDLNNVGFNGGAAAPSISFGLQWLLGPLWFSKTYAILSLLILGLGAWCFFRQSKLSPLACMLGGLAIMLNSTFFSVACWGVGAHDIAAGMCFLALAALANPEAGQFWLRAILAGMALGMGVTEGADIGAIFSVYAAAFIVYQAWIIEGSRLKNLAAGLGRLVLVTACAGFLAAQSIQGLVATSIHGVAGTGQDTQTKMQHWNWATQWSLPRSEALNLVVPGLFGYRMDTENGGVYWGTMGRDPDWDTYFANGQQGTPPTGFFRFSGGGNYVGGLVILVAIWTAAQALRRKNSVFSLPRRKWLWFWLGVAVVSLLLAFGRFAPFYKLFYALPYVSTIRNPVKFLYLFSFAMVVLFAFGVDGLSRQHMQPATGRFQVPWAGLQSWWKQAGKFEKYWVYACGLAVQAGLLGWWIYARHHEELVEYLQTAKTGASPEAVANFSIQHAGWFAAAFFLAAGLMVLILSGFFAGRRAASGGVCLALLLAGDLVLANHPWVIYWDYHDKYASNPVVDYLKDKPYEHRVVMAPVSLPRNLVMFSKLYQIEWMQHQFPYYNIQSFETVEMPRMPADFAAFKTTINETNGASPWFLLTRGWQLTATRFVFGPANLGEFLGRQTNFGSSPFEVITRLDLANKAGIFKPKGLDEMTVVLMNNGPLALFDFPRALPRAKLYSQWQIETNNAEVLKKVFEPAFDPVKSVFVAGNVPPSSATGTDAGTVEIIHYASQEIDLKANAAQSSVLLLNDHFDPDWKVFVDGQRAELLRCNFLMRGVYLTSGSHQVDFKFQPSVKWLYVSLTGVATALLAIVIFIILARKNHVAVAPVPEVVTRPIPTAPIKASSNPTGRKASTGSRVTKR